LIPAGALPEFSWDDHWHLDLLAAQGVHFLPDDGRNLGAGATSQGKEDEDALADLLDKAAPQKQLMAWALGIPGDITESATDEILDQHETS
jgi:hypothetical protein